MTKKIFDYIVVGGGSAGCVVASRLSEGGAEVLLIEAGPRARHPLIAMPLAGGKMFFHRPLNWNLETEPEPHASGRRIRRPAGRVLGGGSSINAMIYTRGVREDYDRWAAMGCDGWSYADVLPYFTRAETNWRGAGPVHGADGPLSVSRPTTDVLFSAISSSVKAAGYPLTDDFSEQGEGFGISDFTILRGRRASAARMYLDRARSRPNLQVLTAAQATRIVLEGDQAVGVEYERAGARFLVRASREVILSGGAYHSPKLLMLSGIGPADELAAVGVKPLHDLPGVGRNLCEHPAVAITYRTTAPTPVDDQLRLDRLIGSAIRWYLTGEGPAARFPVTGMAFLRTGLGQLQPDIELMFTPAPLDARIWAPGWREANGSLLGVDATAMVPQSRGWVKLRSSDPSAPPRVLLNLLGEPEDRQVLVEGMRMIRDILSRDPLASLIDKEAAPGALAQSEAELSDYITRSVRGMHHVVGSCSMGTGPNAVVDPRLRVRGLRGLRVIDASIMPTHICAHTNAPTIMIAEKGADLVRRGDEGQSHRDERRTVSTAAA